METGDDSKIPADLQRVTFSVVCSSTPPLKRDRDLCLPLQAVRHGGRMEYEAVREIHDKPKTPTSRISAMYVPSNHRFYVL
jgi:aminopeptidase 2